MIDIYQTFKPTRRTYHHLATATPINYHHRDFLSPLTYICSPADNTEARDQFGAGAPLAEKNPFALKDDGTLLYPELDNLAKTTVAYDNFYATKDIGEGPGQVSSNELGRVLNRLWEWSMIRRDFTSSCVVDPKSTTHCIGQSMPECERLTFETPLSEIQRAIHNQYLQGFINDMISSQAKEKSKDQAFFLSPRSTRMMNLATISPLFAAASDIVKAKVTIEDDNSAEFHRKGGEVPDEDNEEENAERIAQEIDILEAVMEDAADDAYDGDDDGGDDAKSRKRKKLVESPDMKQYRQLFLAGDWYGWIFKLMMDIYQTFKTDGRQHFIEAIQGFYPDQIEQLDEPRSKIAQRLVRILLRASPKLSLLRANIGQGLFVDDSKSLVFASTSWEQQVYTVVLRLLGYASSSVLATMKAEEKQHIIDGFNAPVKRWTELGFLGVDQAKDVEVLVMSYHLNSGYSLHENCHIVHLPTPAPSLPVRAQAIGRVVRFGAKHKCFVYSYITPDSYNTTQLAQVFVNQSAITAAMMVRAEALDVDAGPGQLRWTDDALSHMHGYNGNYLVSDWDTAEFNLIKTASLLDDPHR
ncbi:hypothetical protein N0V90_013522 [Kalmusia sp. IMI 367209]|nr:hypothetical protein N0V90_013522 [Kalmusia sp. IMI 367209]